MKDEVLKFKNFLYRERKKPEERIELLRDLEELPNWGRIEPIWEDGKLKAITIHLTVKLEEEG